MKIESSKSTAIGIRDPAVSSDSSDDIESPGRKQRQKGFAYRFDPNLSCPNLTSHEKQVLRLVCQGFTNGTIAVRLGVSRETVKSELKRMFRKIGVTNRTQAAVLLVKQSWL